MSRDATLVSIGESLEVKKPSDDYPVELCTTEEVKEVRHKILMGQTQQMVIRWYTPQKYIDAAREVMGDIDVDPASDDRVQKRIRARRYYTKETNGLEKPWMGRVWLNPPYQDGIFEKFSEKIAEEYKIRNMTEGIMMCPCTNNTHKDWFQALGELCSGICFVKDYVKWVTGHYVEMLAMKAEGFQFDPKYVDHPQVLFYFGGNPNKFVEIFSRFGFVKK